MSSKFISESEAVEARKRRQEEWEKVRNASDPIERPEEKYDNRSLFEKLKDQKQKKDLEYEEAHKLKNMVKVLDDDEVEFLDLVDRTKLAADRKKEIEEEQELRDYRNRVAKLQEKSMDQRIQAEKLTNTKPKGTTTTISSSLKNQQKLLKGIVVKKTPNNPKRKISNEHDEDDQNETDVSKQQKLNNSFIRDDISSIQTTDPNSALKCVAILPGLGYYGDSSSDENSSDSDDNSETENKTDFLGRKIAVGIKHSEQVQQKILKF